MKLPANILTGQDDCSNGGISSTHHRVLVLSADATPEEVRDAVYNSPLPAVQVRVLHGRISVAPVQAAPEGHTWYMASGAMVHTSDSRWAELTGTPYGVPLHDRTETREEYRANSTD
jgi:hypothetical protein